MRRVIFIFALSIFLSACDDGKDSGTPSYVKNAASDIESAIIANVIRNSDFQCGKLLDEKENVWTIGCSLPERNPSPFLLFEVREDHEGTNPPFKYKLVAVNGKAKQYAENNALRMFKIDTKSSSDINIDEMMGRYTAGFK
ncbi:MULTISPECIES: hypothetical protein [unclassified Serratia (in: enterobacteria)]|uniref:hypothetical protein n=1 Tax=unclassified Serratia (in: enterobacteria) TaxID=2647522 RepID=UPI00050420EC|nr:MULTISPECIES: hypothetical protein [unclassified Serratia (in: enterobacteria)]KFK95017.1 hypothetical protein IV04_21455 [Serratia sp. Ag1]KFK96692.1 hypothetical protein JV45_02920 [Serratia sp. Ag2]